MKEAMSKEERKTADAVFDRGKNSAHDPGDSPDRGRQREGRSKYIILERIWRN